MEASVDEFRPRAGCKEFVCTSKARPEAALCLYLISSFDEVVVSRLSGRARSDRQRMSLIQRFESCGEPKSPRVKQLIDWTIQAFDGRKYPWFRDEFVHPHDLQKSYKGEPLVNLFAGFMKESRPKVS